MRRPHITTRTLTLLCLLLLLPCAGLLARGADGELSVADYCAMTQSLLEISASEWQERVDIAAEKKADRKEMLRKLEEITNRYRARQGEVYSRYGISPRDDLRYAAAHRAEIENYLEENSEVRNSIESLKGRIDALVQQFESATATPTQGAQR